MRLILLGSIIAAMILVPALKAQAPQQFRPLNICVPRSNAISILEKNGQYDVAAGVIGNVGPRSLFEMHVNPRTNEFAVTIMQPDNSVCLIVEGKHWRPLFPKWRKESRL